MEFSFGCTAVGGVPAPSSYTYGKCLNVYEINVYLETCGRYQITFALICQSIY